MADLFWPIVALCAKKISWEKWVSGRVKTRSMTLAAGFSTAHLGQKLPVGREIESGGCNLDDWSRWGWDERGHQGCQGGKGVGKVRRLICYLSRTMGTEFGRPAGPFKSKKGGAGPDFLSTGDVDATRGRVAHTGFGFSDGGTALPTRISNVQPFNAEGGGTGPANHADRLLGNPKRDVSAQGRNKGLCRSSNPVWCTDHLAD